MTSSCSERANSDRVSLEIWTLALQPFSEYLTERFEAFEANNPGVDVVWVDVPFSQITRKLTVASAAGQAPDVVNLSDLMFARFASLGAFDDLRTIGDPATESVYLPGVIGSCNLGGKLQAYPWYLSTQTLLANQNVLDRGDVSVDELGPDWAWYIENARAFREQTGSYLISIPMGEESLLPIMMLAEGIEMFVPSESGGLRATLATAEAEAFLSPWIELYRDGALPRESATGGHAHLIERYKTSELAVINTGANFIGRIRQDAPSVFEATSVRQPVVGALGRAHVAVMVLGVSSGSEHPKLAASLAAHMTSAESQLMFCKTVNILPSTSATLDDPYFDAPPEAESEEGKMASARHASAVAMRHAAAFTPALEAWPDMRKAFNEGIKRVLLDGRPLDEELLSIESAWNDLLEAYPVATLDVIPTPPAVQGSTP